MFKIIGADGREYGPVHADELRRWVAEGRANAQTKVLLEGTTDWKPLADFPELSQATAGTSAPLPTPRPIAVAPVPRTNPMAVTGMVLGIISVSFGWCCCYGLPFSVPGIIFSLIGISQIKKDPPSQGGKGIAVAGLVLSILGVILAAVLWALGFALTKLDFWRKMQNL